MKIVYQPRFLTSFTKILDFIALDSKNRASIFRNEIKQKIENISHMPFKYKKSLYFEDENIRELTYKGYVIVYEVDVTKQTISVLGIKKYKEKF